MDSLKSFMLEKTSQDVAVAFSGGADSSLILKMAVDAAKLNRREVYAMCIKTTLHPVGEAEEARKTAEAIGAKFEVIEVDEFAEAGIADNPEDRCYRCKYYMFSRLKERAASMGITTILDGTNEDDLHVYRPGIRALKELGILSPLAECGCTKEKVRQLLRLYGIETANKPAMPCLATRFPYGTHLTRKKLQKVDEAEKFIRSFGGYNVRVRVHDKVARIEVDRSGEEIILQHREEIISKLSTLGYDYITLDLEGFRSGSMDKNIRN